MISIIEKYNVDPGLINLEITETASINARQTLLNMSKAFFTSPKAKQVVRAVISMVHGMGLKLVAEGIETRSEYEAITREGIDYVQGFYYSRPLPIQDFLNFLQMNR